MKTILLVDDELWTRRVMSNTLGKLGFSVIEAVDGKEALHILAEHSEIDLVISDTQMLEMDGVIFSREAKAIRPNLPFILTSGNLEPTGHQADMFMLKPISMDDLIDAVTILLS